MIKVGELIKTIRLRKGLTQREVVGEHFSVTYLSMVERDQIEPSEKFLGYISEKLEMGQVHEMLDNEIKEERLLTIFNQFKEHGKIDDKDLFYVEVGSHLPQTVKSSLIIYSLLIRYYLQKNELDLAYEYYLKSSEIIPNLIIEKELEPLFAFYYISCGHCLYSKQDFFDSDSYYSKAVGLNLSGIDLANVYYNLSLTKQRILKDNSCISYSKNAAQIYDDLGEDFSKYRTYVTIAVQSNILGNYDTALEYLNEALDYMENHDNKRIIGQIYYNLGNTYHKLKKFDTAIEYYEKAMRLNEEIKVTGTHVYIYRNLSALYIDIKDFYKAFTYIKMANDDLEKLNMPYLAFEVTGIEAKLYLLQGNEKQYEEKMKKLIQDCKTHQYYKLVDRFASQLGEYYFESGKYKKASELLLEAIDSQKNFWK
jgi:HTH-type transcriptional regulator, quorum sensing regulator NprR